MGLGNARKPIFKDDEDRRIFLGTLQKVNKRYNIICYSYCLIIETPEGNLSRGMKQLNGVYTQMFKRRHKRVGHVFQGRYKAILIQKDSHLLAVCRYVILNPVRAGAVEKPEEWRWSSYRATVGKEKPHSCLTTKWILGQFAGKQRQAEKKYREFIEAGIGAKSVWKEVKGQSILGEEDFAESFLDYVKGYREIKEIPKRQRYVSRPCLDVLFKEDIIENKRKKNAIKAVERYGYSQKEVRKKLQII